MVKKNTTLILISFIVYYVILFVERVYSLIRTIVELGIAGMFGTSKFNLYAYGMTMISIGLFIVCFLLTIGKIISVGVEGSFKMLIITAGALLISGMIHTENTITIIQFIAYIALFVGILLKYLEVMAETEKYGSSIASYVYMVAFAMAVPVVYQTKTPEVSNTLYYVVEALSSLGLIACFIVMVLKLFGDRPSGVNSIVFVIIMAVVVVLNIIVTAGTPNINIFIIVAAVLAGIAYGAYKFLDNSERKPKIF